MYKIHIKKMVFFLLAFMMIFGFATVASAYDNTDNDIALFEYYVEADDVVGVELEHEGIEVLSVNAEWRLIGNHWYRYENNRRITGWRHIRTGNSYFWYYLNYRVNNGRMATGWTWTGGHWFFLNPRSGNGHNSAHPEGARQTGLLRYSGDEFFLNTVATGGTLGAMRIGWLRLGVNYVYFNPVGGAMVTGVHRIGNNYFFFNPRAGQPGNRVTLANGTMRTGRIILNGAFDQAGRIINLTGGVHEFTAGGALIGIINDPARHLTLWWPRPATGHTIIPIQPFNFTGDWQNGANLAMGLWNMSSAPVMFEPRAGSNNTVSIITRGDFLGVARLYRDTPITNESRIARFSIEIFMNQVDLHMLTYRVSLRNVVANVMSHELGHAVGLNDFRGANPLDSIMFWRFHNRGYSVGPTNFDINSINTLPR